MDEPHQTYNNVHDHAGYTPKELYIKPKFSSFKQEIMEYKYLNLKIYQTIILPKINACIKTKMAKAMGATVCDVRLEMI